MPATSAPLGKEEEKNIPPVGGSPASVPPVSGGNKSFLKPSLPSLPSLSSLPPLRSFFSPTRLILLFTVVILLLTVIFFLDFKDFRSVIFKTMPKAPAFVAPINTEDVKYPSGMVKQRFLERFQEAGKTEDLAKRYQLLEDNYSALLGFYVASHDPALRKLAEKYAGYMAKNYPEEYEKNKRLYTVECMDTECGKANYPKEIEALKAELSGISSLNKNVLDEILKKFEAVAISQDKNSQFSDYLNCFSALKSEYNRTKDIKIKEAGEKLTTFMKQSYSDEFTQVGNSMPKMLVFE